MEKTKVENKSKKVESPLDVVEVIGIKAPLKIDKVYKVSRFNADILVNKKKVAKLA